DAPELLGVFAATSYSVRVFLNGEQREYTASALWLDGAEAEGVGVRVLDLITQGVEQAAVEQLPARDEMQATEPAGKDRRAGAPGAVSLKPDGDPDLGNPEALKGLSAFSSDGPHGVDAECEVTSVTDTHPLSDES